MTQEILYSSDAKRLLQELETATASSTRLPALKNPEHEEALHDLYGQHVKLTKETEVPVKPKSPRMTNNELKAMKVAAIKVEDPKFSMLSVHKAMARFLGQIRDVFKSSQNKGASACQQKRS